MPLWATLGHSGATLGRSGPLWAILEHSGPLLANLAPLANSGPRWTTLADFSTYLVHSGSLLVSLMPLLATLSYFVPPEI